MCNEFPSRKTPWSSEIARFVMKFQKTDHKYCIITLSLETNDYYEKHQRIISLLSLI